MTPDLLAPDSREACLVRDLPEPMMELLEGGLAELRVPEGTPEGEDTIR